MARELPTDGYKPSLTPQSRDHLAPLRDSEDPTKSLDFYIQARQGTKRNFVFNWAKARKCPHNTLIALAVGGQAYRCADCNYSFDIVIANVQPLHLRIVGDALNMLHYAKEFGVAALEETLRQPHGQLDGTPHKSALPEGFSFEETLALLDEVDVMVEDGGKAQLAGLLGEYFVSDRERERKQRQLEGRAAPHLLQEGSEDDLLAQLKVPGLTGVKEVAQVEGEVHGAGEDPTLEAK